MPKQLIKEEAHKLINDLPENATWDDLMQGLYTRAVIERALSDSAAGKHVEVSELRKRYGLK